ncbi:protein GLUTAMINE DUMPER 2-like [Rhododendron vialii]|uniref:protein GLUTAMINE DUMPER 2-like n=1 Tax=Rhododendron vialii TaxID=182163 RepID=UPI00265FA4D2|nr:protein GLUTAMINE DUMPER 2-like [Rhododendron vialii]
MRTVSSLNTASTTTIKPIFPPPATAQRSPWHSPMPYLFGGLAAMLCLIAFALLILACSFRRLSRRSENGERDLEAGDDQKPADSAKALPEFEEKYLVIMAGDVNPTFLATPVCNKACSFGQDSKVKRKEMEREKADLLDNEKPKQDMGHDDRIATTTEEEGTESESEDRTQENPDNSMEQSH